MKTRFGHRATQYALEHLINKVPLQEAVLAPWQWQRGWFYLNLVGEKPITQVIIVIVG